MSESLVELLRSKNNLDRPPDLTRADTIKQYLCVDGSAAVAVMNVSFGVSSIVDQGTGSFRYNHAVPYTAVGTGISPTVSGSGAHTNHAGWNKDYGLIYIYSGANAPGDAWFNVHGCGVLA